MTELERLQKVDIRITATRTVEEAMENAAEIHDQTGVTVEVESTLGIQ